MSHNEVTTLKRTYMRLPLLFTVLLIIWQRSVLLHVLFRIRGLVYQQPLILLLSIIIYLGAGVLLSFKNLKILPWVLSGFLLFSVIFNLFASYQEILKFGVNQAVFTGLVNILLHSPAAPLLLASVGISGSSLLGIGALVFMGVKGFIMVKKWFKCSFLEQILLSAAFGFGITAFFTFLLAALQLLTVRNLLITDGAFFCALFLLPSKEIELPETRMNLSPAERRIWTVTAIILLGGLFYAVLFPPLEWDSLAYQAYYSKLIYETNGLPALFGPSIGIEMSAAYPPAYQMLGCYIYCISGDTIIQLMSVLSYISGVLSLIVVFLFASEVIPSHKMYAVVTAVAVPFFLGFSASPHYMTLLIFFNSLFLLYLTKYVTKGHTYSLYVSAAFLGCACLTSYLALASFLFLVIVYLKKRSAFPLKAVGIPVLIALPPLIRNLYFTGNPLFPLFGLGRQLQNPLWASNTVHFKTQTIYAGLSLTSPFSIVDFLMNRISSVRPLLPVIIIMGLLFLLVVRPKSEEKKWLVIWFLSSVVIFLVRPTFDRYLLVYISVYSSFFAWMVCKCEELSFNVLKRALQLAMVASLGIVIVGIVITGPLMVASHLKQFPEQPLNEWAYVRQFYPHDTPCWRWLNENTPPDMYVATYDIRYYYIDKKIFSLDGLEAIPLYTMSYEDALSFLKENNVAYWFSSRWTSPADETCPSAYFDNALTPFLGSDILPLIFVSGQSAVYAVGNQRIDYQEILETENVLYPVRNYEYSVDEGRMVYFDIPGDLHGKTVILLFSQPVRVSLHQGHAASSDLLGELMEIVTGKTFRYAPAYSGKYTLYIESEGSFTVAVLIY